MAGTDIIISIGSNALRLHFLFTYEKFILFKKIELFTHKGSPCEGETPNEPVGWLTTGVYNVLRNTKNI